jgi:hypothetical protein
MRAGHHRDRRIGSEAKQGAVASLVSRSAIATSRHWRISFSSALSRRFSETAKK